MTPLKTKIVYIFWALLCVSIGLLLSLAIMQAGKVVSHETQPRQSSLSLASIGRVNLSKIKNTVNGFFHDRRLPTTNESTHAGVAYANATETSNSENKKDTITIGWVGDIVPYELNSDDPPDLNPFTDVLLFLKTPDLMLGNLEGQITNHEMSKCGTVSQDCFGFKGSSDFLKNLSLSGIDAVNLANNHANDFGEIGYQDTRASLQEIGLPYTGGIDDEVAYMNVDDTTIALIGTSPHKNSVPMNNSKLLTSLIETAATKANIVIVMVHAGAEGKDAAHTPSEAEFYLGENRGDVRKQARVAIDAGADAVFGSGPHVLRGIEFYKDRPIAYSLGNFLGYKTLSTKGLSGVSAILSIDFDHQGNFISGDIIPIFLDEHGFPNIDENSAATALMHDLSQNDFGGAGAVIDDQGKISTPQLLP